MNKKKFRIILAIEAIYDPSDGNGFNWDDVNYEDTGSEFLPDNFYFDTFAEAEAVVNQLEDIIAEKGKQIPGTSK